MATNAISSASPPAAIAAAKLQNAGQLMAADRELTQAHTRLAEIADVAAKAIAKAEEARASSAAADIKVTAALALATPANTYYIQRRSAFESGGFCKRNDGRSGIYPNFSTSQDAVIAYSTGKVDCIEPQRAEKLALAKAWAEAEATLKPLKAALDSAKAIAAAAKAAMPKATAEAAQATAQKQKVQAAMEAVAKKVDALHLEKIRLDAITPPAPAAPAHITSVSITSPVTVTTSGTHSSGVSITSPIAVSGASSGVSITSPIAVTTSGAAPPAPPAPQGQLTIEQIQEQMLNLQRMLAQIQASAAPK